MALPDCTEEELQALYEWVDSVPLSRPKKSISRDFADGVLMAEMVHHYFPKLVELHNYSAAHNTVQKMYNWNTLNTKVFKRMGFTLSRDQLEAVAKAEPGCVERLLKHVRARMARFQESGGRTSRQGSQATGMEGTGGGMDGTGRFNGTGASLSGSAGWHVAGGAPAASTSRPASPHAAAAVADTIAALRLGGDAAAAAPAAGLQAKLPAGALLGGAWVGGAGAGAGGTRASCLAFPTLDQAVAASLSDKEAQLEELRETNEILEVKISKLEQLVRLKDAKISALLAKLQQAAIEQQEAAVVQQAAAAGQ